MQDCCVLRGCLFVLRANICGDSENPRCFHRQNGSYFQTFYYPVKTPGSALRCFASFASGRITARIEIRIKTQTRAAKPPGGSSSKSLVRQKFSRRPRYSSRALPELRRNSRLTGRARAEAQFRGLSIYSCKMAAGASFRKAPPEAGDHANQASGRPQRRRANVGSRHCGAKSGGVSSHQSASDLALCAPRPRCYRRRASRITSE